MCHTWGLARSPDELHLEVPHDIPDLVHLVRELTQEHRLVELDNVLEIETIISNNIRE